MELKAYGNPQAQHGTNVLMKKPIQMVGKYKENAVGNTFDHVVLLFILNIKIWINKFHI